MAKLHITEMSDTGTKGGRGRNSINAQIGQMPAVAIQELTFTSSSVKSAAFNEYTSLIRVRADAACRVLVGEDPTALATSTPLGANETEYFGVRPGDKIAVIAGT